MTRSEQAIVAGVGDYELDEVACRGALGDSLRPCVERRLVGSYRADRRAELGIIDEGARIGGRSAATTVAGCNARPRSEAGTSIAGTAPATPGWRRGPNRARGRAADAVGDPLGRARSQTRGAGSSAPPSSMKSGPATKATPSALAASSAADRVVVVGEVDPEEVAAAGHDELAPRAVCSPSASTSASRRSASASLTNAMFSASAPERQSSSTIDSASMFGEM